MATPVESAVTAANIQGYGVVETAPNLQSLTEVAIAIGGLLKASSIGRLELTGSREDEWMLKHTESITQPEAELLGFFALGCIQPADKGGATVVYDGREAATTIDAKSPNLSSVETRYTSRVYPGQSAVHPLVTETKLGRVLRYRSKAPTNQLLNLPPGLSEEDYYSTVEATLETGGTTYAHNWQPGQLLLVNNLTTIHSREPYSGHREMVRYRFDDPNFATIPVH